MVAHLQLGLLLVLAMGCGVLGGIALEKTRTLFVDVPIEVGDFSEEISFLQLNGIENGVAKGHLEGEEMRIAMGENEIFSLFPGEVEIPLVEILPLLSQIPAPKNMNFVASKSGKYFWALDAPEAALITPKNRIFFESSEKAENQGFVRGKR